MVDVASVGGSLAPAALPRIGLVSQAMNIPKQGRRILLELDETPSAEDLIIAISAGCTGVVAPPPSDDVESSLIWLDGTIRGWMLELGITELNQLTRRNLRALDHDTAAISGLRLIGYDRPLPMWLKN